MAGFPKPKTTHPLCLTRPVAIVVETITPPGMIPTRSCNFEAGVKMRISLLGMTTAMLAGATLPVSSQQLVGVPKEVTDKMDENAILMNKQVPIQINPLQKLTDVSRNGGTILYSVETAVPQEKWTQEMRERPSRETTKVMCGDKDTRLLLDYGFQLRYLFTDAAGLYVTSFVVSKDKCSS